MPEFMGVKWHTTSALSKFVEKFKFDFVESYRRDDEHQIYDASASEVPVNNVHDLLSILAGEQKRQCYLFEDDISFSEMVRVIQGLQKEGEIASGILPDEVLRDQRYAFLPEGLMRRAGIPFKRMQIANVMNWGFDLSTVPFLEAVETTDVNDVRTLKDYARRGALKVHQDKKGVSAMRLKAAKDAKLPTGELGPNTIVFPISKKELDWSLESPIHQMDWLHLKRCDHEATVQAVGIFLAKQLGVRPTPKNAQECAEVLAEYFEDKEEALVEALALPKVCVATEVEKSGKIKEQYKSLELAEDLPDVEDTLKEITGKGPTGDWLRRVLCRAVVILHQRGGRLADPNYRTTMFGVADLLRSLIKSDKSDDSDYLRDFVLIGTLSHRRDKKESKATTKKVAEERKVREAINELPESLF